MTAKILIVEDVDMNIDLLEQILEDDYAIITAKNGAAGVEMAERERPDLILMDISLPVMNGLDATRMIMANPSTASIPVVALTAHAMHGDRDRALASGCRNYLSKPIDEDRLLETIRSLVPEKSGDG